MLLIAVWCHFCQASLAAVNMLTPIMKSLFSVLCLFTLISVGRSDRICCPGVGCFTDGYPFDHLPLPKCSDEVKPTFTMYTRSNRDRGQAVTKDRIPGVFNSRHPTAFVVHGFMNDGNTPWLPTVKNHLLNRGGYNVIIVDWRDGSSNIWYPQCAANTRLVGKEISLIVSALERRGSRRSQFHCIGHSLGAHTCGHAGKAKKLGRISGHDPAGPLYENYPNEAGLYRTDADFVDVIHTMGKEGIGIDFGTLKPLGHVDFYPNGGGVQPGCINYYNMNPKLQAMWGLKKTGDGESQVDVACSHGRASLYYAESIRNECRFVARSICSNERDIPGSCRSCSGSCQRMGYFASPNLPRGKYYLTTNSKSPFCQS